VTGRLQTQEKEGLRFMEPRIQTSSQGVENDQFDEWWGFSGKLIGGQPLADLAKRAREASFF